MVCFQSISGIQSLLTISRVTNLIFTTINCNFQQVFLLLSFFIYSIFSTIKKQSDLLKVKIRSHCMLKISQNISTVTRVKAKVFTIIHEVLYYLGPTISLTSFYVILPLILSAPVTQGSLPSMLSL